MRWDCRDGADREHGRSRAVLDRLPSPEIGQTFARLWTRSY
jgi:hypothetical protein